MGKKQASTPKSQVRSALRRLWLRSRERAAAIKRENGCCEVCHSKQSAAKGREVKLEIHHLDGIEWENILSYIYRHLLVNPSKLEVLCKTCHDEHHKLQSIKRN